MEIYSPYLRWYVRLHHIANDLEDACRTCPVCQGATVYALADQPASPNHTYERTLP